MKSLGRMMGGLGGMNPGDMAQMQKMMRDMMK